MEYGNGNDLWFYFCRYNFDVCNAQTFRASMSLLILQMYFSIEVNIALSRAGDWVMLCGTQLVNHLRMIKMWTHRKIAIYKNSNGMEISRFCIWLLISLAFGTTLESSAPNEYISVLLTDTQFNSLTLAMQIWFFAIFCFIFVIFSFIFLHFSSIFLICVFFISFYFHRSIFYFHI